MELLLERYLASPVIDGDSGEVLYDILSSLDEAKIEKSYPPKQVLK